MVIFPFRRGFLSGSLSDGGSEQYFEPYPWQNMLVRKQREGDLDDYPPPAIYGSPFGTEMEFEQVIQKTSSAWPRIYAAVTFMDQQVGDCWTIPWTVWGFS